MNKVIMNSKSVVGGTLSLFSKLVISLQLVYCCFFRTRNFCMPVTILFFNGYQFHFHI